MFWRRSKDRTCSNGIQKRKKRCAPRLEVLEPRLYMSGSNAIDTLNFGDVSGDATSESVHNFEPGYNSADMPLTGTGALGETYREAFGTGVNDTSGPQALHFTMQVSATQQNYLTIKLWGSDVDGGTMYLLGEPYAQHNNIYDKLPDGAAIDHSGGSPAYPGRFFYYTVPIPESWTMGKTSVDLTLNFIAYYDFYGGTGFHYLAAGQLTRPVYAAYTATDPYFIPDSSSPAGTAPTQSTVTLSTLTAAQAQSIISGVLNSIYGSNGYYQSVTSRQVQPGTSGAPPEVVGLDLFSNLSSWMAANPNATPDQWRNQIADQKQGRGYTGFPDELLSVLTSTYLTTPMSYAPSAQTAAYHSGGTLADIVSALDGASYMQGSDGGFPSAQDWTGLTTSPRTTGPYAGISGRVPAGWNYLEGIDTATLGETIVNLLNDPTGGPAFKAYLAQSYDADLNGGQMLRAYAYERMLYNNLNYLQSNEGGAVSQDLFQTLGIYADQVALEKLQQLFPNAMYPALPATLGLYYAQQAMGLAPTSLLGHNESADYAISAAGLGEENGTYSGGYDNGYGVYLPQLTPYFADLAADDPGATTTALQTVVSQIIAQSANTINAYDQFISSGDNVTFNSNGSIAADQQILSPESFITYRNTDNPDNGGLAVDSNYLASDPNGVIKDAYALRSAYLETQFGITPQLAYPNNSGAMLQDIRMLGAYQDTINSLVNVSPAGLTPLPGEPGQANFAFADVQTGAVAFINNGERFYMNANWRQRYYQKLWTG